MSDDWLIQWLRNPSGDVFPRCAAAADRIEALERAIWTMHGEANEHIKRIEALEKRWDLQVDDAVRMAAERISQLEAALRIIAGYEQCIDNTLSNVDVARRALENQLDVTAENIVNNTKSVL